MRELTNSQLIGALSKNAHLLSAMQMFTHKTKKKTHAWKGLT